MVVLHLQCETVNVMLLKVLAHARKVDLYGNPERFKELRPTNARKLENMRGLDGAVIK